VVAQIAAWASEQSSAPARLLNGTQGFVEWVHYPQAEAIDPHSGWRFYYHAHPPAQRLNSEHGHFHVFAPPPTVHGATVSASVSHLVAISVTARGLPLRLFTTNRWVTDEIWQPADRLAKFVSAPSLHGAEPHDVGRWLDNLIILFAEEIVLLLRARDARIAASRSRAPFEDRRLRIPSQRRIDLTRRLRKLET